jgi:hypothetical protein
MWQNVHYINIPPSHCMNDTGTKRPSINVYFKDLTWHNALFNCVQTFSYNDIRDTCLFGDYIYTNRFPSPASIFLPVKIPFVENIIE